jgi:hypothetical protein
LAVVGGAYYFFGTSTPTARRAPTSNPAATRNAASGVLPLPEAVKLAALGTASPKVEVGRNPFTFGARPAPPPPPRPAVLPPPVLPPVVTAPPPPVGPPPIPLKMAGSIVVQPNGRPMATLKDTVTSAVYQVFEGDVVDGRYRIIKIGLQSVVVSYLDGTGQRTIAAGG